MPPDGEFDSRLPKFLFLESAVVARAGVDGLTRDKGVVIPGAGTPSAHVWAPSPPGAYSYRC